MPCTTLLVGKKASYDGSTMMARNEDSGSGHFCPKKLVVVRPDEQPRRYRSVISGIEIELPDDPLRYTAMPNALPDEGLWAAAGVNAANVAMTATETITSNPRVQGADPLVKGGIGEEDLVTLTLPYIRSAREGVERLGALLERYGTYEMNGIGFQDADEIWWLETIGGHHWIAKRVPDDMCVVMPNQQGIDAFDLEDAFGEGKTCLCSADLLPFITDAHLDLKPDSPVFDARAAFGSEDDSDRSYNTPRAWDMLRRLCPSRAGEWTPEAFDLPWCVAPERLVTPEDVKYLLSSHFQGTPFDPYAKYGDLSLRGKYRPIGINRNNFLALTQIRPGVPAHRAALEWIAMGSNVFNAFVPLYANAATVPEWFSDTEKTVSTGSFYWTNRLIGALADAQYDQCRFHIERYQNAVACRVRALLTRFEQGGQDTNETVNEALCAAVREETFDVLDKVLYEVSCKMRNGYARSDA